MASAPTLDAYNPADPLQTAFLAALALGETGGNAGAYSEGVGGGNLAGAATDQYGFPVWTGQGQSHAAGAFQFQPGTWSQIAATYGLNFQNPEDQNAGAWYEAEQQFQAVTGGSLETALATGVYQEIETALASVWPSVTGNASAPQGLAYSLANNQGAALVTSPTAGSGSGAAGGAVAGGAAATPSIGATDFIGEVEGFFVRFGLVLVGGIVVIVALWQLLSDAGAVPSPAQTAKGAGAAIAHAGAAAIAA
jgi:muramidase (phage lysozyme)